jgi:hypothetical protein
LFNESTGHHQFFNVAKLLAKIYTMRELSDRRLEIMDKLKRLFKDNPQFHDLYGKAVSWALSPATLRRIFDLLTKDMHTIETGGGHSTVMFAIAGTKHVCVTYTEDEVAKIKEYNKALGVGEKIEYIIGRSDLSLPQLDFQHSLDFILIDGAHFFPLPIIDWHYTERHLRIGGILCLDDYKMPSVRCLFDFLCTEDEWSLIEIFQNTAFFKKIKEPSRGELLGDDWKSQRYNNFCK